jgi:hypothetical protein
VLGTRTRGTRAVNSDVRLTSVDSYRPVTDDSAGSADLGPARPADPAIWSGPYVFGNLVFTIAGWSSSVARWAHNPEVAGSNPVPATRENGRDQAKRSPASAGGRFLF